MFNSSKDQVILARYHDLLDQGLFPRLPLRIEDRRGAGELGRAARGSGGRDEDGPAAEARADEVIDLGVQQSRQRLGLRQADCAAETKSAR